MQESMSHIDPLILQYLGVDREIDCHRRARADSREREDITTEMMDDLTYEVESESTALDAFFGIVLIARLTELVEYM
jgi:hypothetical protein